MPLPKRKPNRLKQYDYSQSGAHFITICVKDRQKVFWAITRADGDDVPGQLSQQGLAVEKELRHIGEIYGNAVAVDKYVIMPNHVHLIVFLQPDSEQAKPIHSIAHIINQFKVLSQSKSVLLFGKDPTMIVLSEMSANMKGYGRISIRMWHLGKWIVSICRGRLLGGPEYLNKTVQNTDRNIIPFYDVGAAFWAARYI
ncbi:MAG TPA: hypothetical protein VN608_02530 [Clostridia bacterium]|nr:hypothetical protein [Clostridia bacterium]